MAFAKTQEGQSDETQIALSSRYYRYTDNSDGIRRCRPQLRNYRELAYEPHGHLYGSPLTLFFEAPDSWKFLLPLSFLSNDFGYVQWTEPENSNLVNLVNFGLEDTRDGTVDSDHSILNQFPIVADGTIVEVGTDGGVPVFATFHDNAEDSETSSGHRLYYRPALFRFNGCSWR